MRNIINSKSNPEESKEKKKKTMQSQESKHWL